MALMTVPTRSVSPRWRAIFRATLARDIADCGLHGWLELDGVDLTPETVPNLRAHVRSTRMCCRPHASAPLRNRGPKVDAFPASRRLADRPRRELSGVVAGRGRCAGASGASLEVWRALTCGSCVVDGRRRRQGWEVSRRSSQAMAARANRARAAVAAACACTEAWAETSARRRGVGVAKVDRVLATERWRTRCGHGADARRAHGGRMCRSR